MLLAPILYWTNRMGRPWGRPVFLMVALLGWGTAVRGEETHPLVRDVVVERGTGGSGFPLDAIDYNVDPRSASPSGIGLLRYYGCITCHDLALPPYRRRWGPDLDTVGSKTTADWIDRFLANSEDVQPGRTMPRVPLTGDERAHLVAFLTTQTVELGSIELGEPEAGNRLFEINECLRCHSRDGLGAKKAPPLDNVGAKVRPDWLVTYLQHPARLTPNTTMPLFDLTPAQARDLAAYVLQGASIQSDDPPSGRGRGEEGARIFAQKGCAHCHRINALSKRLDLPSADGVEAFVAAHETVEPAVEIPEAQRRSMSEALLDPYSTTATLPTEAFVDSFWQTPIPLQGSARCARFGGGGSRP